MGKYRKTRKQKNKQKKIIIISALSLLLLITVGYAAFQTNLTITAKGNIKEKSRVIQVWDDTSQTDFHTDFYKQNIVSATFLDNASVPSNATESWNVSEDKENGGVKAWVIPNNEDNTKYDLYIGAKDGVIANEISYGLFYNFTVIKSINFNNNFDTSNATNMLGMFTNCTSLTSIDVSSFNTSNVTNMSYMFTNCSSLTTLDLSTFDTRNVTDMQSMFDKCYSLTDLNISNFDTSKVTTMAWMFAHVPATSLNVSGFDTSKVTDMTGMFIHCSNLTSLDLSGFNTSQVTTMRQMFQNCESLTELDLCSFDTRKMTDFWGAFAYMFKVQYVLVGPNWTTANADTTNMFIGSRISSVTTGQC